MPFVAPEIHLSGIAPELALSATALVVMLLAAFVGERGGGIYLPAVSTAGIGAAVWFAVAQWGQNELQLANAVAADGFSVFVEITLAGFGLLTIWLSRDYLRRDGIEEAEFYALVLFALAGMMLMASAADLVVMFVALETFSIALYVLVGFRRQSLFAQESAMKYFLLGAFSSAFFLMGIALTYGAVGSTNLYRGGNGEAQGIVSFLQSTPAGDYGLLVIGMGLLLVGLCFKVAAVPFHAWTPDAYQGAPSPVTGFMAAATKIAAFAAVLRLFDVTLFQLRWDWRPIVIGIAVLTMVAGSLLAVVQENVKRILAYSSIAHAGFVFTGVLAANDRGVSGTLFYLSTYGLTVLGAFAITAVVGGRNERRTSLSDYRGLYYEHPALAGALAIFLLSLAGVPITAGFVGKLVVFGAAIEAGYVWVVVVGLLASAVAAFFYLRIMVVMYMQRPQEPAEALPVGPLARAVIGLAVAATLFLGLYWSPLIDVAQKATLYFAGG